MEKPSTIYSSSLIYYLICSAQSPNEVGREAVRILSSQDELHMMLSKLTSYAINEQEVESQVHGVCANSRMQSEGLMKVEASHRYWHSHTKICILPQQQLPYAPLEIIQESSFFWKLCFPLTTRIKWGKRNMVVLIHQGGLPIQLQRKNQGECL